MTLRFNHLIAALAALSVAACSSDTVEPTAITKAPRGPAFEAGVGSVPDAVPGHVVVLKNKNSAKAVSDQVAALGGTIRYMHAEVGIAIVDGLDDAGAAKLAKNSGTSEVMRDELFTLDAPVASVQADGPMDVATSVENPATAARYNFQWNMRLIGADKAWAAGKLGSAGITVAIIDTGIDYTAPDMAGLVDLTRSVSFVAQDDAIATLNFPTRHKVDDFNGHGTNVATQVSSKAVALAGVTSKTTLIGIKVLGFTGSGSTAGVLAGVLYAADNGADIANMSLGSSFSKAGQNGFHSLFNKVFNYAKQKGMLIVVAAGNASSDLQHNGNTYAAYCDTPHVICVSSVGPRTELLNQDEPAYYTNYGRSAISVAAPGGSGDQANGFPASPRPWGNDTRSWVWSYCARNSLVLVGGQLFFRGCQAGNLITGYVGTSQAAPHVAGLAALLMAEGTKSNNLRQAISKAVDKVGGNGNTPYYGAGRISVSKGVGL